MNEKEIVSFFKALSSLNPHPKTELYYTNPYTLLVAVMLSAQSTDKGVNKVTEVLFEKVHTPQDMLDLGEEALRYHIQTIGLYKTKAKNILKTSQKLVEAFKGKVPSSRPELDSFPGVGRKTANVVLNVAFHQDTFPVDTHVFRVCNRTGIAPGKTPKAVEEELERVVPFSYRHHAHHWLILHGRYICKARSPLCKTCPVSQWCDYFKKTFSFAPSEPSTH